ncbi:MAG: amidohydrolase [Acidimicrobiaceae bacterium]|jgi:aminocarboxymuconate-semialdehyde decarboxylase|nr:amidohydrolase [Acidimicrobiaceae bacterium]|tara:strand:+ start:33280 stop:34257 length:978 start_codon:yes stop_codon:yes gene_type:complete
MSIVIDLHAHVVLEDSFGTAGRYGPELSSGENLQVFRVGGYEMRVPYRGSVFMDAHRRVDAMNALGVDVQLLSPNPLSFFGHINTADALRFAKATNDAMVGHIEPYKNRLFGAAAIPLQDPEIACEELQRAVNDLGLIAAYIGTDYGFSLDDPKLDVFYETVVALDIPLFIHPATNNGIRGSVDERLSRFGLDLILGYAYEETIAVASLVLGGVMQRHPSLDVCVSHGGGAITFLKQRFESMAYFMGTESNFAEDVKLLWFDSHLEEGPAHDLVVSTVGSDRMVFGTNFGGWDTPTAITDFDRNLAPNAIQLLRLPWEEESGGEQ